VGDLHLEESRGTETLAVRSRYQATAVPEGLGKFKILPHRVSNPRKKSFWVVKCGWCVGMTTLPPSMSLSRQCGILNMKQPYRLPRPVTGIVLLIYFLRITQ
jgi:hypothetical protein